MEEATQQAPGAKNPDPLARVLRWILAAVAVVILLGVIWLGVSYSFSPAAIRTPKSDHFHFRMQVIVDGKPMNFADAKFQTPLNTDICTQALTDQPVHFHDQLDQFVHIHWAGISGGLLLKDYGWNFIAGPDDTLGYRFDKLPRITRVSIHGFELPKPPADASYYIYTGDQTGYQERRWDDFLHENLRDFFAGKTQAFTLPFVGTALAHGDEAVAPGEAALARLNDVVGSTVIFVQKDKTTDSQIKDRFNHLIPLPTSSCSG